LDKLKSKAYQTTSGDLELHEVSTDSISPYQHTELADSAALMRQLIEALPEQQKLILHLRDVEEYSFEEIQEVTGMTVNNIRVILSRARKEVRDGYLKANRYESGY
jgi:RNA polymerase sigma-70 factor (ECF subfamily)